MSQQTFKIHFILKLEKTDRKELVPIYARIRLNGMKMEITTNRKISKEQWDSRNELAYSLNKTLKELNQYLENFKGKIYSGYTAILSKGQDINTALLKEAIFGVRIQKKHNLIETVIEHNNQFEEQIGIKYSYGSYKNYKTTLKYLIEFIPFQYKQKDISLESMDYKFCQNYFAYLTTKKQCNNNGANKQLQRIKKIVNYAIRSGYINFNPLAAYSLKFKPAKKTPLTMEEINQLTELTLQRVTLKEVRDIFIFQCYTGLSYADIKGLASTHINTDGKGQTWIKMQRQKTEVAFSVPLLRPAMILLQEYSISNKDSAFLFPVLSNQKMNENLKVIQEIAGITKNLTTHLARHSFATTITLNNDVPIETVSKMLGHTNLRTTQLYAKVLDNKIGSDMQKLKDKLQ